MVLAVAEALGPAVDLSSGFFELISCDICRLDENKEANGVQQVAMIGLESNVLHDVIHS